MVHVVYAQNTQASKLQHRQMFFINLISFHHVKLSTCNPISTAGKPEPISGFFSTCSEENFQPILPSWTKKTRAAGTARRSALFCFLSCQLQPEANNFSTWAARDETARSLSFLLVAFYRSIWIISSLLVVQKQQNMVSCGQNQLSGLWSRHFERGSQHPLFEQITSRQISYGAIKDSQTFT